MNRTSSVGTSRTEKEKKTEDNYTDRDLEYITEFQQAITRALSYRTEIRNAADRDDIAQASVLWLLDRLQNLKTAYPEPHRLARTVVGHRAIDWIRHQSRQACERGRDEDGFWLGNISLDSVQSTKNKKLRDEINRLSIMMEREPEDLAEINITGRDLESNLVRVLGPASATAFIRVRLNEESTQAVAADLGISANVLTHRLRRIERKLRAIAHDDVDHLFQPTGGDFSYPTNIC